MVMDTSMIYCFLFLINLSEHLPTTLGAPTQHLALTPTSVLTSQNGLEIPMLGFGTWQVQSKDPSMDEAVVRAALDAGYRHIDTAFAYMNEVEIGKALSKWFQETDHKRDDVFITTKLPHNGYRPELVEKYLKKSLSNLNMDFVDLFLIHTPVGMEIGDELLPRHENGEVKLDYETNHTEVWKAMEKMVDAGLAKGIGVSNFNVTQLARIVNNCRIRPDNVQVEMHVYLQQNDLLPYCREQNITFTAYSPLGAPGLKNFHEMLGLSGDHIKPLYPLQDPVVLDIAKAYKKSPAQILIRFLLQTGVTVIPKSSHTDRIKSNFDVFDFELSQGEMRKLKALDKGPMGRIFNMDGFMNGANKHPEFPWNRC